MNQQLIELLATSLLDTLLLVGVPSLIAVLVGIPMGVVLVVTARGAMLQNLAVNRSLGAVVNITRSVPFIILMVAIIPFTRLIAQTSIGTTAAIVPLSVAAIPFMARIAENAMREVDRSEEHTSELQSLMRISYAVFCLKKKKHTNKSCIN